MLGSTPWPSANHRICAEQPPEFAHCYDGYRLRIECDGARVPLITRGGYRNAFAAKQSIDGHQPQGVPYVSVIRTTYVLKNLIVIPFLNSNSASTPSNQTIVRARPPDVVGSAMAVKPKGSSRNQNEFDQDFAYYRR